MRGFRALSVVVLALILVMPIGSAWARSARQARPAGKAKASDAAQVASAASKPGHVRAHHKKNGKVARDHHRRAPSHMARHAAKRGRSVAMAAKAPST
jgi:hypothetical protein